jgi:hypothetical protein
LQPSWRESRNLKGFAIRFRRRNAKGVESLIKPTSGPGHWIMEPARLRTVTLPTEPETAASTDGDDTALGGQSQRLNIRGPLNGRPSASGQAGKRARRIQVGPFIYPHAQPNYQFTAQEPAGDEKQQHQHVPSSMPQPDRLRSRTARHSIRAGLNTRINVRIRRSLVWNHKHVPFVFGFSALILTACARWLP